MHETVQQFLNDISRKITARSADDLEDGYLFQRILFQFWCTTLIRFCCTAVLFQFTAHFDGHSILYFHSYFLHTFGIF